MPSTAVIITGGGGFLGQCLAVRLLEQKTLSYHSDDTQLEDCRKVAIHKIILADRSFPPKLHPLIMKHNDPQVGVVGDTKSATTSIPIVVKEMPGDITDPNYCRELFVEASKGSVAQVQPNHCSVFHLAGVMSGDGERDFDLCIRVNLQGFLNMMEAARHHPSNNKDLRTTASNNSRLVKFIFTSSGFSMGSPNQENNNDINNTTTPISDTTRATPQTTYGATKACCELLLTDYARRHFVDARGVRLPTILVRAGAPNAAVTGGYSGVIREPLAGQNVILNVASNIPHAVTSARAAVAGMLTLHNLPLTQVEQELMYDRTVFLPAVALSLEELEQALKTVVTQETHDKLGSISYQVDESVSAVVKSFPMYVDASRAIQLGIPPAPSAQTLVREYVEDFPGAVVSGIALVPPE